MLNKNNRITKAQFDELVRRENPEVYTEQQISNWIIDASELLNKSELDEMNEVEKAEVKNFADEFKSFTKITVVSEPETGSLNKGMNYTTLFIRERQVEFSDEIMKGENGEEIGKSRYGVYTDTEFNRKMGRVGGKFLVEKSEETNIEKGGKEKPNEDNLEKGGKAYIGEIHTWGNKKYRKEKEGHWVEVSEHGKTPAEHYTEFSNLKKLANEHEMKNNFKEADQAIKESRKHIPHMLGHDIDSMKQYTDEEVNYGKEPELTFANGVTARTLEDNGMKRMTRNDYYSWADAPSNAFISESKKGITAIYGDMDGETYMQVSMPSGYGEFFDIQGDKASQLIKDKNLPKFIESIDSLIEHIDEDDFFGENSFEDVVGKSVWNKIKKVASSYGFN